MSGVTKYLLSAILAVLILSGSLYGQVVTMADFEQGPGLFDGAMEVDSSVAHRGRSSGVIRFRPEDKDWVQASRRIGGVERDLAALRFWVRSNDVTCITLRMIDATGQVHQQRHEFPNDGQWHRMVVTQYNGGDGYQAWGGVGDRLWHPPAREVSFVVERRDVQGDHGSVHVDTIQAALKESDAIPVLGNVFAPDEPVSIPLVTRAERVQWTASDFWGQIVQTGTAAVEGNLARIRPRLGDRRGYFLLRLSTAGNGDKSKGSNHEVVYRSFAVIPRPSASHGSTRFGVMTHFAQGWDVDVLPLVRRAGLTSIRDEHYWSEVETKPGNYSFPRKSVRYMAASQRLGLEPLVVMSFANPHYDDGLTPYTDAGRKAFGRYGESIVGRFGDQVKVLEVWNEYNGSWCSGPSAEDRPRYYTKMLREAYERVKRASPGVTVLGGAAVNIPVPYLESIFRHGGLKYMDGLVIHPYRKRPDGVNAELARLESKIREYNSGQTIPIWVTETGSQNFGEYEWESGLDLYEKGRAEIARYLIKQYALLLTSEAVERVYWYLLHDTDQFLTMGLLRAPDSQLGRYAVAAPYVALATLIQQLQGKAFVRRDLDDRYAESRVYHFRGSSGSVRVCWSDTPVEVFVKSKRAVEVVNMMGEASQYEPRNGRVRIALGPDPVFVRGKNLSFHPAAKVPRVLANFRTDYSEVQNEYGWTYGYYQAPDSQADRSSSSSEFREMQLTDSPWGTRWTGPSEFLNLDRNTVHPGFVDGRPACAVARWTSPVDGRVNIKGHFQRNSKGRDGCEGIVFLDGEVHFRRGFGGGLFPQSADFDFSVDVGRGTHVDFAVSPGVFGELLHDGAEIDATITDQSITREP